MKYEIVGDTLPVVICHLNKGEKMISDSGAMAWMDPCMKMETNGGGAGKIIGRMFSGETLFGGEGFILTKVSGHGTCFIEIDGSTVEYNLLPGQQMVIDTGYLAMMDATCKMDIQSVPGLKNKFLGGEGLFNTVVTGPGKIVVQTMPISAVANSLARFFPQGK